MCTWKGTKHIKKCDSNEIPMNNWETEPWQIDFFPTISAAKFHTTISDYVSLLTFTVGLQNYALAELDIRGRSVNCFVVLTISLIRRVDFMCQLKVT